MCDPAFLHLVCTECEAGKRRLRTEMRQWLGVWSCGVASCFRVFVFSILVVFCGSVLLFTFRLMFSGSCKQGVFLHAKGWKVS